MKNKKRLLSLALASTMLVSMVACGNQSEETKTSSSSTDKTATSAASSSADNASASSSSVEEPVNELAWLNTESELPIIKDGEEKKKLTIYTRVVADAGKPEDSWLYRFLTDRTNLELEFVTFTDANAKEIINLAFASGELPDIIIGAGLSTTDIVKYGNSEGQILDLVPYINETYMPNLTEIYEKYPDYKLNVTDSEGHIYSLGYISNPSDRGNIDRIYLNYDWLDECGLEVPETLDEFIDAMRAFQDAGLAEHPIGGSKSLENPMKYILNAMGYVGANSNGSNLCLRNDQVVLPYTDREVFGEYLKVANQLYEEQLIHPDFFTMDSSTTKAFLAEGTGIITQAAFLYDPEFQKYWAPLPLTSEWNDTPTWTAGNSVKAGSVVITSACEYPEVAAKFLDFFYSDVKEDGYEYSNYRLSIVGYESDDDPSLEYGLKKADYDGAYPWVDYRENMDDYSSYNDFLFKKVIIWNNGVMGFNALTYDPTCFLYEDEDWTQYEDVSELRHTHELLQVGDTAFRVALQTVMAPYVTTKKFPSYVYLDEATASEMSQIGTAMWEYAQQEIAKFITGARELTDAELDNYFDTLDGLGAQEYLKVYSDYYESVK